jgi:hypothetical protein
VIDEVQADVGRRSKGWDEMSKQVEVHCRCGSWAAFKDGQGSFINNGGSPDARGRVFLIEVRVDEWLDRHTLCIAGVVMIPKDGR